MIRRSILSTLAAVLALAACDAAPTAARAAEAGPAFNATPLTVSILGPTTVPYNTPCTWIADVSGGTPPYEYAWISRYTRSYSSYPDFTVVMNSNPDFVRVTVRDAAGQEVQLGQGVTVSQSADFC
jgi:hypothetical protein